MPDPDARLSRDSNPPSTRASLLLRLRSPKGQARELAWADFAEFYGPMIRGFARRQGCPSAEIDDVMQEVFAKLLKAAETFEYDPKVGKFRGFLKVCTTRAVIDRHRSRGAGRQVSLDEGAVADESVSRAWEETWEAELLDRAIAAVRADYQDNSTFQAWFRTTIRNESVAAVGKALQMEADSVYQARTRVLAAVRQRVKALRQSLD